MRLRLLPGVDLESIVHPERTRLRQIDFFVIIGDRNRCDRFFKGEIVLRLPEHAPRGRVDHAHTRQRPMNHSSSYRQRLPREERRRPLVVQTLHHLIDLFQHRPTRRDRTRPPRYQQRLAT